MFIYLHQLPLPLMFLVVLATSLAVCWVVIAMVRVIIRLAGFPVTEILPVRDSIIGACTTIFALMVAFTAAGIWSDALAARSTSQREADAVENALMLAGGLPTDMRTVVRERLNAYVASVISHDWPEMRQGTSLDAPAFRQSEDILIGTIGLLSRQQATLGQLATYAPLLNQLLEVRHARLARLAASNAGITWAQWFAMMLISTCALIAIAACNAHSYRMQIAATHLYVLVVSAAYFVILAHDRPFIGRIAVQPVAFESLASDTAITAPDPALQN